MHNCKLIIMYTLAGSGAEEDKKTDSEKGLRESCSAHAPFDP